MTIHEMLQNVISINSDIDYAAQSLGMSDYCPTFACCSADCTKCWRAWLEKEVSNESD